MRLIEAFLRIGALRITAALFLLLFGLYAVGYVVVFHDHEISQERR